MDYVGCELCGLFLFDLPKSCLMFPPFFGDMNPL